MLFVGVCRNHWFEVLVKGLKKRRPKRVVI